MRIAIFSDLHLGFSQEGREADSFEAAKAAFNLALSKNPDLILLCGDIFNSAIPSQEILHQAFGIFSIPKCAKTPNLKISKGKTELRPMSFSGIPVIAIHGTHEYRPAGYKNILEVMESAGFLIHLHASKACIENNDEKVNIFGLGGIPEKKALDAIHLWNPKPEDNSTNILLLHQALKEFLPFDDEMIATISISDLPSGFDLIVDGHLHWHEIFEEPKKKILICGSTITTQMKKLEAEKPKTIFIFDTEKKLLANFEIPNQRKFYYEKIDFANASFFDITTAFNKHVDKIILNNNSQLQPLIRIKFAGTLAKGLTSADINTDELEEKYKAKAVLSVDKAFATDDLKIKIKQLSDLQKSKKSILSIGLELLEKNLALTNFDKAFDVEKIFSLLEAGDDEAVLKMLLEKDFLEKHKIKP